MRTVQITNYGSIEALTLNTVPPPVPDEDEALVAVVASTINPVDVKHRTPDTKQEVSSFPATLGWDIAGIVLQAPASSAFSPGDRVIALHPNAAWADQAVIPAERLVAAPTTTDLPTSATLPLASLTALHALRRLSLQPGERLLVAGAAGAVGGMAVQLARHQGIEVDGLVSRYEHIHVAEALGAAHTNTSPEGLGDYAALFDTAGVLHHPHLIRQGGRVVTVSDDPIPTSLQQRSSLAVTNYVGHDPEGLNTLARLVETDSLTLRVAAQYPLTAIHAAHHRYEAGGLNGKIILTL